MRYNSSRLHVSDENFITLLYDFFPIPFSLIAKQQKAGTDEIKFQHNLKDLLA